MTYEEASKRISVLLKALKSGKISDAEKAELAELKAQFPKKGKVGGNDFSFWNKFHDLMKDAANVAYNYIPGTVFKTGDYDFQFGNVAIVSYIPTPGICSTNTDAFNLWSRELYLELHRKYRGLGAYSWEDLGIIVFCILDIFGRIAEAEFIYGLLNDYPINNRIRPEGVLSAMGFQTLFINTIKQNMADYRYRINLLITKASQLCLPKGMTYLKNRISLNAFMYADSKDKRASYIKFVQTHAYNYEAACPSGSAAVAYPRHLSSMAGYTQYLSAIEQDMELLLGDTDVARVCSDLLAALGDGGIDKLQPMPEGYNLVTVYDAPTLSKFHNLEDANSFSQGLKIGSDILDPDVRTFLVNSAANWVDGESLLMQQYNGNVVFDISMSVSDSNTAYYQRKNSTQYGFGTKFSGVSQVCKILTGDCHIIDTWESDPKEDTIAEACLWKRVAKQVGFEDSDTPAHTIAQTRITSCGPEFITGVKFYRVIHGAATSLATFASGLECYNQLPYQLISDMTKFDWHPIIFAATSFDLIANTVRTTMKNPEIVGDLDNTAPVTNETIARVHDVCLLSSFVFDGQTLGK